MNVAPRSFPDSLCEQRLRNITLFIARVGRAYLFLSQLFWKPLFGNPPGRFLRLDVPLRERLGRMVQTGSHPARWLMRLT